MAQTFSIFGTGPFSQLVVNLLQETGAGQVSEFVVDDDYADEKIIKEKNIVTWSEFKSYSKFKDKQLIFAIGYRNLNKKRKALQRVINSGANLANLILSNNTQIPKDRIGQGNIIFPGAFFESNVTVGSGNVFWSSSHICHDVSIGDCNFFAAKSVVGGNTSIRNSNFIGLSASIRDNLVINDCIELGMGATLVSSQLSPAQLIGTPAKPNQVDK